MEEPDNVAKVFGNDGLGRRKRWVSTERLGLGLMGVGLGALLHELVTIVVPSLPVRESSGGLPDAPSTWPTGYRDVAAVCLLGAVLLSWMPLAGTPKFLPGLMSRRFRRWSLVLALPPVVFLGGLLVRAGSAGTAGGQVWSACAVAILGAVIGVLVLRRRWLSLLAVTVIGSGVAVTAWGGSAVAGAWAQEAALVALGSAVVLNGSAAAAAGIMLLIGAQHGLNVALLLFGSSIAGVGLTFLMNAGLGTNAVAATAIIGFGSCVIGLGSVRIARSGTGAGVALLGCGLAFLEFGVVRLCAADLGGGVAILGLGVIFIGLGAGLLGLADTGFDITVIGSGLAVIGSGANLVSGSNPGPGAIAVATGVATLGLGAWNLGRRWRRSVQAAQRL